MTGLLYIFCFYIHSCIHVKISPSCVCCVHGVCNSSGLGGAETDSDSFTGSCFLRTDQLDGETDWKLKVAVLCTQRLPALEVRTCRHTRCAV